MFLVLDCSKGQQAEIDHDVYQSFSECGELLSLCVCCRVAFYGFLHVGSL